MAIVEMKKMTLVAAHSDRGRLLKQLQRMSCVQIANHRDDELAAHVHGDDPRLAEIDAVLARVHWAIGRISRYAAGKKPLFAQKPLANENQLAAAQASGGEALALVSRLEENERKLGELTARDARDRQIIDQLRPWQALNVPLSSLGGTAHTLSRLYAVPLRAWESCQSQAAQFPIVFEEVSRSRGQVFALCVLHKTALSELDELIKQHGLSAVYFPDMQSTPAHEIDRLETAIARGQKAREALESAAKEALPDLPMLKLFYDITSMERDRISAGSRFASTQSAFIVSAWVPEADEQKVREAIFSISPSAALAFEAPGEDEKPPTLLHNRKVLRPFESILSLYSMPDPRGIDPTFIMAPFFLCYFGMMVSDAGYGIILTLLAVLALRFLKPSGAVKQIMGIMVLGGLSTVLWGALYGGWFGLEFHPLLFAPMSEPLGMMALCLGFGALHIFSGIFMAMYMNLKRGQPLAAFLDQGLWVILLVSLPLLAVPQISSVAKVLAIASAAGIALTAARDKPMPGRLISGLGKLYDLTGYLSDLLSYARLFGMGLATGVIGMVLNEVASLMMGSWYTWPFALAILIGGHAFNLAINALGAYVHSCRLQYIEFFGKFYESGGTTFTPLMSRTRYNEIAESDAQG